jgi:hypothetical protein
MQRNVTYFSLTLSVVTERLSDVGTDTEVASLRSLCFIFGQFYLFKMFHYKYFRYYTLTNSVTLPLMYFRFNYVTVFACIFVTIIVSVNEMDVFPLTDISVTVIVNGKNTGA